MEKGDIGGWYTRRQVVVLEPLLFAPPEGKVQQLLASRRFGKTRRMLEHTAEQYTLNTLMCQWIADQGYRYSMPTEVWSFLPMPIFDLLQPQVDRLCGDYVVEWNCWSSVGEAYTALRINQDITTVYDADIDRVERYWHLRGTRVLKGSIPT